MLARLFKKEDDSQRLKVTEPHRSAFGCIELDDDLVRKYRTHTHTHPPCASETEWIDSLLSHGRGPLTAAMRMDDLGNFSE